MRSDYSPGLEGVTAGQTAISTVGKTGLGLSYRGYSINDLAEQASFEEVAHLLIHGELPDRSELASFRSRLMEQRKLPEGLKTVLEQLPASAHPMDVLRTGCSALGAMEPEGHIHDQFHVAERLLASFPSMLLYWYHFRTSGSRIATETTEESLAGHFLTMLHGRKLDELQRKAVDVSLILYGEHEFNASTFSARVTTSTLSDFYSAITSGIGTLRGPLHGGANEEAMRMIGRFNSRTRRSRGLSPCCRTRRRSWGSGTASTRTTSTRAPPSSRPGPGSSPRRRATCSFTRCPSGSSR